MTAPSTPERRAARAFTLIEVLVVMGIIVLLIALALPAFNFITGSRSTEAAGNQIAAALGVARAQAIGLQKYSGIMFVIEPTSDRVQITLVQEADERPATETVAALPTNPGIDVYLDLTPDTEFSKLPTGVGVQTVTNGLYTTQYTTADRYIGFNTAGMDGSGQSRSDLLTKVGGVILFDKNGMLASKTYALRTRTDVNTPNRMGELLFYDADIANAENNSKSATPDYVPVAKTNFSVANRYANAPVSQLGIVMYDANVFDGKGFTLSDQRVTNNADIAKEQWLDENATPLMINRYNGTLVRGE